MARCDRCCTSAPTSDAIPIYVRGLRSRETRWLFVEFFKKLRPLSLLVGIIDGLRAIVRGLRMRKRRPSLDFERHLDRLADALK